MRILITGSEGMLGQQVIRAVKELGLVAIPKSRGIFDITDARTVSMGLTMEKPNIVINCAGIVRGRTDVRVDRLFEINAHAPHLMAGICDRLGIRMVQVSTDCVFSGDGSHVETDIPNAEDDYGKSKAQGEINYGNHLTVRCSFIGIGQRGLLSWLMTRHGMVPGFQNVQWNGMTIKYAARAIVTLGIGSQDGILHIFGTDTSKYEVLVAANDALGLGLTIVPTSNPIADFRLRTATGISLLLPSLPEQLREMADDYRRDPSGS